MDGDGERTRSPRCRAARQRPSRAESWRRALTDAGASAPPLVHGDRPTESGHRAGLGLVHRPEVTAVFAANDQMAPGPMRALHESGGDVPGDIGVAGFDGVAEAAHFHRRLTTVHQDFEVVGRHCVALSPDQIEGRAGGPATRAVEPALVVRSSTGPPRPGPTS